MPASLAVAVRTGRAAMLKSRAIFAFLFFIFLLFVLCLLVVEPHLDWAVCLVRVLQVVAIPPITKAAVTGVRPVEAIAAVLVPARLLASLFLGCFSLCGG